MFTVLIAEKEHIDAIQQDNKLFFEPFLESKELAFCAWNPEGQTLKEAVPGLLDAVGRQKKWRAVVVNHCVGELLKSRNPFDIVDSSVLGELKTPSRYPEENEKHDAWEAKWENYYATLAEKKQEIYKSALTHPLQKLSTWLCYRPEGYLLSDVKEHQDAHEWAIQQISKENSIMRANDKLDMLEREQYRAEQRMKELIRKEFAADKFLSVAYPTELHCITLRTSDGDFFNPEDYWNIHNDNEYSAFADRNMYFDKMRFMVFDILPKSHRDYRTDYIRFLASLLIIATNPMPGSAVSTRRLYRIEAESDDTPLCTLVTSYDRKLAATAEVIEAEMEKIRGDIPANLSDKEVEAILAAPRKVSVTLDESCNPDKVFVENEYGLFFDSPENEFYKWNRCYDTSTDALAYIVKQQSRAIRKSVSQAQLSSEIPDIDVSRLTPFQIDDIRDYTDSIENDMVDAIPPDLSDISRYTEILEKRSDNVKKAVRRRMTKKTTVILGLLFLGLFLICFMPFMFSNGSTPKTVSTAIIFTAVMLGLLLVIMIIALFCLRTTVTNAVRAYNNAATYIIGDIMSALGRFSKYLSASCNVRRGHAVRNRAGKSADEFTRRLRIRQKHQEDIRRKRAYLAEEYNDYFGDKTHIDEFMARPYEYDFDHRREYEYPAPFLAGDSRQIEFMNAGNFVTVPSSYIKRITVRMEGIYE